jgi:hypothetical protein
MHFMHLLRNHVKVRQVNVVKIKYYDNRRHNYDFSIRWNFISLKILHFIDSLLYLTGLWNGPRLQDQGKRVLANQEPCSMLRLLQVSFLTNQESCSTLRLLQVSFLTNQESCSMLRLLQVSFLTKQELCYMLRLLQVS